MDRVQPQSRSGQRDGTWEHIRESGIVRFGMEASYAPFEALTTSGELFGLDVDLAREVAGRMGARAEFVTEFFQCAGFGVVKPGASR